MRKYDSYKDSGIEWIGEIPSHWHFYNLKFILREGVKDGPHETPVWFEDGIPFLSIDGIVNGEISFDKCRYIDEEQFEQFSKKLIIEKDDIFIGKAASIGKIARVKTDRKFTVWSPIAVVKVKKEYNPIFVEYYFKSDVVQHQIELLSTSNTQKNIAMGDIPKMKFIAPSEEEQTAIANYLDHKIKLLDDLIAKKERLIELLEEERTAIINQAVTKGLDPTVSMKDSGVEWLGEIPAHWEVKRLKLLANIQGRIGFKGYTVADLVSEDEGALTIGAKHIDNNNKLNLANPEFISWDKYYESPEIMVKVGDILLTQRGTLGKVVLVSEDIGKATINPSMVILSDLKAHDHFLYFFFNSSYFKSWIDFTNTATAVPMISQGQLGNLKLVLPDMNEQKQIVNQILISTKRVDEIITKSKQEIELLKEYKTALISEVVTGKVDVRYEKLS